MKKWLKNRLDKIFPGIYTEEHAENVVNNARDNGIISSDITYKRYIFGIKIRHLKKTVKQEYQEDQKNNVGFKK